MYYSLDKWTKYVLASSLNFDHPSDNCCIPSLCGVGETEHLFRAPITQTHFPLTLPSLFHSLALMLDVRGKVVRLSQSLSISIVRQSSSLCKDVLLSLS